MKEFEALSRSGTDYRGLQFTCEGFCCSLGRRRRLPLAINVHSLYCTAPLPVLILNFTAKRRSNHHIAFLQGKGINVQKTSQRVNFYAALASISIPGTKANGSIGYTNVRRSGRYEDYCQWQIRESCASDEEGGIY
jgi:hypothetical protein